MSDPTSQTTELRMCITCGKWGGSCRWTDDAEQCMRKQIIHLRTGIEQALAFYQITHVHAALREALKQQ